MTTRLLNDCFRPSQRRLLHAEAIALLESRVRPIAETERVPLAAAVSRTLAETVRAPNPVPAHTNSAVDGFAFAHAVSETSEGAELAVCGRAAAGRPLTTPMAAGSVVRIFTGAVMPEGTDTVAMQEDVAVLEQRDGMATRVRIPGGLARGANVRRAGEDIAAGDVLLGPGRILRPQDLAALASAGRGEIECFRRLRVAVVSTGDEVRRAGTGPLRAGEVYDSNAPMLFALAELAGARTDDLGVWPDDATEIRRRLGDAARHYDVILTSGGASLGEEDHMSGAIDAIGSRHFWQLAIKPGRPMMFGQIGDAVVIGLPGNPVAVLVCFLLYAFPLLRRLGGSIWPAPRRFRLRAAFGVTGRKTGRREFWRGMLRETPAGPIVDKFARDGSGLISGLRAADGLIDIPEDTGDITEGDLVSFIPFSEFGILGP